MSSLLNIIWLSIGISILIKIALEFVDKAVLLPEHRQGIQKQFERWWKTVKNYNKLKFAITCAIKANEFLDKQFGTSLMSKRVLSRTFLITNSLLIVTLSWIGFVDKEPFGVTPWKNYTESVIAVDAVVNKFLYQADLSIIAVATFTNAPSYNEVTNAILTSPPAPNPPTVHPITNMVVVQIGTNTCLVRFSPTAHVTLNAIEPIGHGGVYIRYDRFFNVDQKTNVSTNFLGNVQTTQNPYHELVANALLVDKYVNEHNTTNHIIAYSVFYFVFMFLTNALIFTISLMGCRIMLREMILAARTLSTVSLVITNSVSSLFVSIVLLLVFTVLALPLLWLLAPVLYYVADESIYTLSAFLSGIAITLWVWSGTAAKIIALLGLMPSLFAIAIGIFSSVALKWKNQFHWLVSAILNRFVKNGAITVVTATITFITAVIALVAKWLHLTAFM